MSNHRHTARLSGGLGLARTGWCLVLVVSCQGFGSGPGAVEPTPAPPEPLPARFSPGLCTKPQTPRRSTPVVGERFLPYGPHGRPIHLDQRDLIVRETDAQIRRIALGTGRPNGGHALDDVHARRDYIVLASDARSIYVWSVSSIETGLDRVFELMEIDLTAQVARSIWKAPSDRYPYQIAWLMDFDSIYWTVQSENGGLSDLVRTTHSAANPTTLVAQANIDGLVQDDETLFWVEHDRQPSGITARIRKLAKAGGTPSVVVEGLKGYVVLKPRGDALYFSVERSGIDACDLTLFVVGKNAGPLRAVTKAPGPGNFLPHGYGFGFLWNEHFEMDGRQLGRIWLLDEFAARLLVDTTPEHPNPTLVGVVDELLYWSSQDRVFRAPTR